MNIIGISVLEELRKHDVFKHAIIAGGMCRDHILGGKFKDVDVFVPTKDDRSFFDGLNKINDIKIESKGFGFGNFKFSNLFDYNKYTSDVRYQGKFDGLYRDTIPVQIMSYRTKTKNFAEDVVHGFNYWIDQSYWDGSELVSTPNAEKDMKKEVATLCRLSGWEEMPQAMSKFLRLKEKYPNLKLASTFEIVDPNAKKNAKDLLDKVEGKKYTTYTTSTGTPVNWQIFDDPAVINRGIVEVDVWPPVRAEVNGEFR